MARNSGFTLVELLVALTILAMIAGLLTNSMGFSLKTSEAVEARILAVESFHQAQRAFRRQVQLAQPIVTLQGEEPQPLDFLAAAGQLDFIAPLPGLAAGGALYRISLRIDDGRSVADPGARLVMTYSLYLDGAWNKEPETAVREVVLLDGFSRAGFSYLDTLSPNGEPWVDDWRHQDRLPDLVRLSIELDADAAVDATELIVAIKAPLPVHLGAI